MYSFSSAKTLVISFIGMATQEVAIKPNLNITLKPDTETLEEVIVTAYGTAKKSAFTGSASVIKADEIGKVQTSYLQPIITQYFIDNKSEIWLLFLIAHSKR